jgi:septal ring factor EnvC (AmiA/AmiB activator)
MHEEKLEQSGKEELSLLSEMERLDEKIAQQKTKIDTLKARVKEQQQVIDAKEKELATIAQKNQALQQHLTKRLKAFYLMGKTGFLNIVFSSKTLPQLLLTQDAFHSLITYDQSVFAAYRESVTAIDRIKRSHELEKSVLENFLADADKEGLVIQQAAEEKSSLLKRVQTQRGLYEQALKEMKKAEGNLTSTLTGSSRTQGLKAGDFSRSKGKLPPPVWGEVTSLFRQASSETDDTTFTNGITINTPDKTEVYAVYDGEVIFSGYMRGYGKMLIIDHDQQYYTVTAGFEELRVKEGALVKPGQVVGLTGKSVTLFGKGLYFEIRHGVLAENPLDWLQPGTLTAP